VKEIGQGNILT